MKQLLALVISLALFSPVVAQADKSQGDKITRVNALLDSVAFYNLRFDYRTPLTLPDSVKAKMVQALGKQLPRRLVVDMRRDIDASAMLHKYYNDKANRIKQHDTLRELKTIYDSLILVQVRKDVDYSTTRNCIPSSLVLACGSWGITQALPLLRHYLADSTTCVSHYHILAAMAKLGDSWAYGELLRRSSIEYLVERQLVDTLSWDTKYEDLSNILQLLTEINNMARYLKSKELLLCAPDFLKIKGSDFVQFSGEMFYRLTIIQVCSELNSFFLGREKREWNTVIETYRTEIWKVEFQNTSKDEKQKIWDEYLSDAYIQKIIDKLVLLPI